jgi:hypothetical protein
MKQHNTEERRGEKLTATCLQKNITKSTSHHSSVKDKKKARRRKPPYTKYKSSVMSST